MTWGCLCGRRPVTPAGRDRRFVAEGAIDYQAAASRVRDETSQTGYLSRNAVSSQEEQGASPTALNGQSSLYIPPTQQQLFVFLRGVQWRAPDANTVSCDGSPVIGRALSGA